MKKKVEQRTKKQINHLGRSDKLGVVSESWLRLIYMELHKFTRSDLSSRLVGSITWVNLHVTIWSVDFFFSVDVARSENRQNSPKSRGDEGTPSSSLADIKKKRLSLLQIFINRAEISSAYPFALLNWTGACKSIWPEGQACGFRKRGSRSRG